MPHLEKVSRWVHSIDRSTINSYKEYWHSITPTTDEDHLRRWLFSFMSVHTTWASNVAGYKALADLAWINDKNELRKRITNARVGMQFNRTQFIWAFTEKFLDNPRHFRPHAKEGWQSFRDRLVPKIKGLGYAKTSFAIEMLYPTAHVFCLDVHLLRFLDAEHLNGRLNAQEYRQYENYWIKAAKKAKAPAPILRHIFWDQRIGEPNTRYWSHCLEQTS